MSAKGTFRGVWQLIRQRQGIETLPAHLEQRFGTVPITLTELDAGVYRVDRRDGPPWVARLFPSVRAIGRAEGDANVLRFLEDQRFPAERLAHPEPVSIHEGQGVLVTRFVAGSQVSADEQTFHALGEYLGRLHTLPQRGDDPRRSGGAIHSLTLNEGSLRDEVTDAMSWLAQADISGDHRGLYDDLRQQVARVDFGDTLPHALLHPDPTPQNVLITPEGEIVAIDWTGAGYGPRVHALAFLLLSAVSRSRWKAQSSRVDAVIDGYRRHVTLDEEECAALAAAMPLHVLVRDCAAFCMGRMTFDEVAGGYSAISRLATPVSIRARRL